MSSESVPRIPDYSGATIRGIVPALLGPTSWDDLPAWMPPELADCRQVVLLVLDGLGWEQLVDRSDLAPTLRSMAGGPISSVVPTTTATALTSIATGLCPSEHGIVGYRMALGGEVLNTLRWCVGGADRRRSFPPVDVQPHRPFLGHEVPVVNPAELQSSAFTEAHLRGGRPVGWRAMSSLVVEVDRLLRAGERFVYAYYAGVDRIAHERGFGPFYDAELRTADRLVGDVLEVVGPGVALLVTADHGQVEVGDHIIMPSADVLSMVALQSGEGRFRWFHSRPGATNELFAAACDEFGDSAWVVTRQQVIDEQWFGPSMPPPIAARLGDVALVARDPVSFHDPDDDGPYELICRHGSLTPAEIDVPLLCSVG